jgi:hypothetical protein
MDIHNLMYTSTIEEKLNPLKLTIPIQLTYNFKQVSLQCKSNKMQMKKCEQALQGICK